MVEIAIDPFWTLALALLLDAAIGRPSWLRAPIDGVRSVVVSLIDGFDRRLNRLNRSDGDLKTRGAVAFVILGGGAFAIGWVLDGWFAGSVFKAILVAAFFAQRRAFDDARAALRHAPDASDLHAAARGAIAALARRFGDDVVGPALAYAILGLAGLFLYAVTLELADRLRPTDASKAAFGRAANTVARAFRIVGGAAGALLIALASIFSPGARLAFGAVFSPMTTDRNLRPAATLAAISDAYRLGFEGRAGWIGDGKARQDVRDVRRVLYLFAVACLVHLTFWATLGFVAAA